MCMEKRPAGDAQADRANNDDKTLKRGYRDRSPRRNNYSQQEREREGDRDRSPRRSDRDRDGRDSYRPSRDDARIRDDPLDRVSSTKRDRPTGSSEKSEKKDKKDKPKKERPVAPSEPMIIVNVNDRLGTKAAIPCLASDSVKAFKAIVAANIGRQPHEIMLKRQGERPFKDILTLADYGVSSGVQLDLEIDTGD
jgi:hypothetical protein